MIFKDQIKFIYAIYFEFYEEGQCDLNM